MTEDRAAAGGSRLSIKLACGWLVLVIGGAALGRVAGIGPFAWLETWWAVNTGSLLSANILFVILILALPAIWPLLRAVDRVRRTEGGDPARARRHAGRTAIALFALAGVALATAILAGVLVARLPDGTEPAVPLTAEMLAQGVSPERRVAVTGAPVEQARAAFSQPSRRTSRQWAYFGFRLGATRGGAPESDGAPTIALFVERSEGVGAPTIPVHLPAREAAEGYLIENGLPPHARIVLEQAGVRIASPHYLLRGDDGLRDHRYTLLLLGLVFAAMFGFMGTMVWLVGSGAIPLGPPRQ